MNRCKDCGKTYNNVRLRPVGFPLVDQRGPWCDDCWDKRVTDVIARSRRENAKMRIITFALMRAQADPDKKKDYPKSYSGTQLKDIDDPDYIWLRVGVTPNRRTIAIPKTNIVKVLSQ